MTEPEREDDTNVKIGRHENETKQDAKQKQGGKADLINYKGVYFGDDNEKFHDEETGAHFHFGDICKRLVVASEERRQIDLKLNVKYKDCRVQSNRSSLYGAGAAHKFRDDDSGAEDDDVRDESSPPSSQSGSQSSSSGKSGNISDRYLDETDELKLSANKQAYQHMRTQEDVRRYQSSQLFNNNNNKTSMVR